MSTQKEKEPTLPKDLCDAYEVKRVVPGKIKTKKFGMVDLTTITPEMAAKLAEEKSFPFLEAKKTTTKKT